MKEDRETKKEVEFTGRTEVFWNEIDGIISLLNLTDPKHTRTHIESPQVMYYLLWRILTELKILNTHAKI